MSKAAAVIYILPFYLMWFYTPLLIYVTCCTNYYYLVFLYVAWMYYDRNTCNEGGRMVQFMRNFYLTKKFGEYVNARIVKTVDLDPSRNYLLCAHPHGVYAHGPSTNFASDVTGVSKIFPGIRTAMLTVERHFWVPIQREFISLIGALSSSEKSLRLLLSDKKGGNAPVLCVGGVYEVLESHPNQDYVIHLSKRRRFIKIAMQQGVPLVPVFTFGENDLYEQISNPKNSFLRKFQDFVLNKTGMPISLLKNVVPKPVTLTTVVGEPLEFEKVLKPTEEDIDRVHSLYVESLTQLFEAHKHKYGETHRNLIFC